jgi:hypothetical protein
MPMAQKRSRGKLKLKLRPIKLAGLDQLHAVSLELIRMRHHRLNRKVLRRKPKIAVK